MMRKKKANTAAKVDIKSIPAPIGGLNARDSIADMPETDAVILDNWFPTTTNIQVRNGYVTQNSNPVGWVETIMAYNGPTKKLFSIATENKIRDVTSSLTGGSAAVTGLTNARFQYVNIATAGGNFLLAVNGADKLQGFDGTSWWVDGDGTHDITGFDTATAIHVNLHKSRVWMTQKNTTKAYYLGLNSIAGAATAFDFGSLFQLGGYLMGMATWSINDGSGLDDYAVFVSSEGEVLIYKGYDPAFTSTWALAAHFRIGRPIGRRFFVKDGADLVLITADGAVTLSKSVLSDRSKPQEAISYKISNLINNDVMTYNANFGWQPVLYPIGKKFIVNVPQTENVRQYQYVMNKINGAWCTFGFLAGSSPWNAACFEVFNDSLYFGGNNGVFKCDTGSDDNGSNIVATAKPAFSYFNKRGLQKLFTMIKPYFFSPANVQALVALNVDFSDTAPTSAVPATPGGGTPLWDVSPWDTTAWGGSPSVSGVWQTVNGVGNAATCKIVVATKQPISLQAIDYVYQPGGIL
jgi:hypothetical protein